MQTETDSGFNRLFEITVEGSSIIIIYVDATQGWVITDASKAADITEGPTYIVLQEVQLLLVVILKFTLLQDQVLLQFVL